MARALKLAARGMYTTQPNPRVGCVIVKDNRVVGEGWHIRAGEAHAEINALKQAGSLAQGASCYVTLEPCAHTGKTPPCTDALIATGITKVIAAMTDPNPKVAGKGLAILNSAGIDTTAGLLDSEACRLNPGFIKRMHTGMPYVRCKLAMSLDGKIALANGISKWISGEHARKDGQRLRAQSCAILTGSGTVLADDPALTVREVNIGDRKPLRVIADRRLRTAPTARLFQSAGRVVIFTENEDLAQQLALQKAGAEIIVLHEQPFIQACLQYLAIHEHINEVLVEAGAALTGSLVEADLVDELIIYQAPIILGSQARSLFDLPELTSMSDSLAATLTDIRHIGDDIRYTYQLNKHKK
jgi:diaminohydroxyphosphoribosylaminopyrimidine deaminase/5-amino-6-(5-phosphoribosylamino)uracil reductase